MAFVHLSRRRNHNPVRVHHRRHRYVLHFPLNFSRIPLNCEPFPAVHAHAFRQAQPHLRFLRQARPVRIPSVPQNDNRCQQFSEKVFWVSFPQFHDLQCFLLCCRRNSYNPQTTEYPPKNPLRNPERLL